MKTPTTRDLNRVFGILKSRNTRQIVLSIEQMNEIARQGWAGERTDALPEKTLPALQDNKD